MGFLDFISPISCLQCAKSGRYLCELCVRKATYTPLVCPVCRRPNFYGKTHDNCMNPWTPDGGIAVWRYDGVIQKAIKAIKYKFADQITTELSFHLIRELKKHRFAFENPVLIPIPLNYSREKWRGFNQSAVIGAKVSKALNWSLENEVLLRSKSDTPQAGLRAFFRSRNIRGKFTVNGSVLDTYSPKHTFILFDDVWTSGSTLFEATRTLKKAGAVHVWILSICR